MQSLLTAVGATQCEVFAAPFDHACCKFVRPSTWKGASTQNRTAGVGYELCVLSGVPGARHFSQLICWQLADSLRQRVLAVTPRMAHDFKRRAQMEDASDSVCRNIAEGFGCLSHAEFARYLEIARRSLNELVDSLRSARLKGYMSITEFNTFTKTINRLYPAINKLIAYLRKPDAPSTGDD